MRYYLNNFQDGKKQDALDLITGTYRIDRGGRRLLHPHSQAAAPVWAFACAAPQGNTRSDLELRVVADMRLAGLRWVWVQTSPRPSTSRPPLPSSSPSCSQLWRWLCGAWGSF